MRRAILCLGVAALAVLAWVGVSRLDSDLTAMLPAGDPALTREARYFTGLGSIRVLVVEAETSDAAGDAPAVLHGLIARLASFGAHPAQDTGIEGAARTLGVAQRHLPELTTAEDLAQLAPLLEEDALRDRLLQLKERIQQPDDWMWAAAAQQDVLGLAPRVLTRIEHPIEGVVTDGPLLRHPDGRHVMVRFTVDFPADDIVRGRSMLAEITAAAEDARQRGVTVRWSGSYRHYVENADTVADDLVATIPIEVVLVGVALWTLVRSWRALAAIHLPVIGACLGVLAGAGAWALATGLAVPLSMLGFTAGILGIAVDYGTHTVAAAQNGHRPVRQLVLGFLATASAFCCLLLSSVPALQCLGAMIVGGLGLALAGALSIPVPRIPAAHGPVVWVGLGQRMNRLLAGRRWTMLAVAAGLTVAAVPGLMRLRIEPELRAYDGSSAAAWRTLDGIIARWGVPDGSTFIIGESTEADEALRRAAQVRTSLGFPAGTLERCLPDAAEQVRRREAWNRFWVQHSDFPQRFAAVCRSVGLRVEAFAPGLALYAPMAADRPLLTAAAWEGTALAPVFEQLLRRTPTGWQASSPLPLAGQAALDVMAQLPADAQGWIANRTDMGQRIVLAIRNDLLAMVPMIALAVMLTVGLAVRSPLTMAALLLPPLLALVWAFGAQGWMGMALTPFSLLAVTFVLGIGIDSAVFLHADQSAMPAILVAWLTTVLGTGALLLANHPVIWSLGVMLSIGMTAAFIAALLVTPALRRPAGGA